LNRILGIDEAPAQTAAIALCSRQAAALILAGALALPAAGCDSPVAQGRIQKQNALPEPALPPVTAADTPEPPVVVETVDVPGDVPAFVLRGTSGPKGATMIFLHGRCTHGLGYVQAFQFTAARKGSVIAPQGDQACGATPFRRWSPDLVKLNARIEDALRAAFEIHPEAWNDMVVMGYSEGASRAEALAARWPERYSRVILIGAPAAPSAARLKGVRGVVLMAGDRDRQDPMKAGMRSLQALGIPATFISIAGAAHGQMGDGERVMGDALDWLWANAKPARE
jgi:pimeloyl-ACP methyl ester carboxylesterase